MSISSIKKWDSLAKSNNLDFISNLNNEAYLERTLRKGTVKEQKSFLYKLTDLFVKIVIQQNPPHLFYEGDLQKRTKDNIKFIANCFDRFYKSTPNFSYFSLANLVVYPPNHKVSLIEPVHNLINVVLQYDEMDLVDGELMKEVQAENALYALQLFSKIDDRLDQVSKSAERVIKGDLNVKKQLLAWKKHCVVPLRIKFSIKPYYLQNSLHLPKRLFTKQEMEFWKITKIFIGADCLPQYANLQEIGKKENFTCTQLLRNESWLRDFGILHQDGRFLMPMLVNNKEYTLYETFNDGSSPLRPFLLGYLSDVLKKYQVPKNNKMTQAPFVFEGGNVIPTISIFGNIYFFGANNIACTFIKNHKNILQNTIPIIENNLNLYENLYDASLIESAIIALKKSKIDRNYPSCSLQVLAFATILGMKQIEQDVSRYLNARIVVLGSYFSETIHNHIDTYFSVAPGRKVFVQDYEKTVEVLEKILSQFDLNQRDTTRLKDYLLTADALAEELEKETQLVVRQLEAEGFVVHLVPGVYHARADSFSINYLNGIFGLNDEEVYFITNNSGHSVDRYLRDEFLTSITNKGIDRVYFTGSSSEGYICFSGRKAQDSSALDASAGIRCSTIDVNALTHSVTQLEEYAQIFNHKVSQKN